MSRGNWIAALFVDEKASVYQVKALTRIMTGQAGGTTHLLSILVGRFLGVWQEDVRYEVEGSPNLSPGSWSPSLVTILSDDASVLRVRLNDTTTKGFLRLKVTLEAP